MRRREAIGVATSALLLVAVALLGVRVAAHWRDARAEVGRVAITRLEPRTLQRLASLRDRVFITYYVTDRARMPSHLRRLESGVTDFLEAVRKASAGRVEYQVVDPASDEDLGRYASRRRVSPFRVRQVMRDAYSEQSIWSSLTVSYGPYRPAEINGVTPEHLPRLQALLVEQLDRMESPRQGVIGLAPASGFSELHAGLAETATVVRLDLDGDAPIAAGLDALIWIDPRRATPTRLRELSLFRESGRSVVIAGSSWRADLDSSGILRTALTGFPAELLADIGLRPVRRLACDTLSQQVELANGVRDAPWVVRCIGPNQDFHALENQPNGTIVFDAPSAFALDAERLAERGWSARVLGSTSEKTWLHELPWNGLPLDLITPEHGEQAPKQPLIVLLQPDDPWQGWTWVFAASTPFQDGNLRRPGAAHVRLLRTLTQNLLSAERLVLTRVNVHAPPPIPELTRASRLAWRAACVLGAPLVLVAIAAGRGAFRSRSRAVREAPAAPWRRRVFAVVAASLALAAVAASLARRLDLRADLTEDGLSRLAPESRRLAAQADEVEVELLFSARDRLPPELRPLVRRAGDRLRDFARAGAALRIETVRPEDMDEADCLRLESEGIAPARSVTREEELSTVRSFYSAVRLRRGDVSEVLRFPDAGSFEDLEFRLAFALWRLEEGRGVDVVIAPDLPRPSAAESFEYYQQQGLAAPMGSDVNSLAARLLQDTGFDVSFVNPRDATLPRDADVFVWLQPRRPQAKLLDQAIELLHGGGSVLLAAQHFRMQSRQYSGTAFVFNYWPQPQSSDVEQFWFPDLGITMVREVLFDRLMTRMVLESQVSGRGSMRDYEQMELALPFLIRAAADNMDRTSTITRGIGDQAFLFGNHLELDAARLEELGIRHRVLATTSERTWTYPWKGGWLPPPILEQPADGDGDGSPDYLGKLPLIALFEGTFPLPAEPFDQPPKPADAASEPELPLPPDLVEDAATGKSSQAPDETPLATWERERTAELERRAALRQASGRLLFVTNSELFKDHRLTMPGFRGDRLLVNAVATLGLPEGLAEVACRRAVPRGFDFVEPDVRLGWRVFVLTAWPAMLLLLGGAWSIARRRV